MTETQQKTTKSNDNIQVVVTQSPGCQITMEVEVTPLATQAAYAKAVKEVGKNVTLPGFRKGKAPASMLAESYGSHIDRNWHDILVDTGIREAITLTKFFPNGGQLKKAPQLKKCNREDGAFFVVEYEAEPQVSAISLDTLDALDVKVPDIKPVTEEVIKQAIKELRDVYTKWEPINDRTVVEKDDSLILDIDALGDKPYSLCKGKTFKVADEHMAKWLQDMLIGHNVGEQIEGMSEHDEKSEIASEDFKPTNICVKIVNIVQAVCPETDEDLAKQVGLKDVEQLHKQLSKDLEARFRADRNFKVMEDIQKGLLEVCVFDAPTSVLEKEKQFLITRYREIMKDNIKLSEDLLAKGGAEIAEKAAEIAEGNVKLFFLERKLLNEFGLEVSQQDMEREYHQQMSGVPAENQVFTEGMTDEEKRERLIISALRRKVEGYILDRFLKKQENA